MAEDHGDFVRFEGGFALHEGTSLLRTVFGVASPDTEPYGRRNLVLYFESERLEEDFARLAGLARIVHPIRAEPWGQRVFRLLDPDGHIVEIGEPQAQG